MVSLNVFVFIMMIQSTVINGRICPNSVNGMKQDKILYESVRYGHYVELECCSNEESEINWMKWNKETKQWQNYLPDRIEVRFVDRKHILAIQSSSFEDAGLYKCKVQNVSVAVETKFQLNVIACDKLARGPFIVSPEPCAETLATEKEVLTLPCTGYFGCSEAGDIRIVSWYVSVDKNKEDNWVDAVSVDKRYKQTNFQQDDGSVQGSNLTIQGVSPTDFNRKFMCVLATPQMVKGQSQLIVTLSKDRTADSLVYESGFSSLEVLVVVLAVAVVSVILNVIAVGVLTHDRIRRKKMTHERNITHSWVAVTSKGTEDNGDTSTSKLVHQSSTFIPA